VLKKSLGHKQLPGVIICKEPMQREECMVYKQEVCLEGLWVILEPLVGNCMSIVNVYGGGALTLVGLMNIPKAMSFVY
jgi:hypothetical protein